ncbi:RES family NAD+ phosphorylase [Aquicoccus porphyridii]|uniref:RES family NAD+ phosphorylase n=1 Tax=Aquicoccus porphyridii TaxID=1852029 RepID=UPI001CAA8671|nr:RES family NAD+ phosphorylase [Aquicoccus porphyridii]
MADYFELLLTIYPRSEGGKSLVEWLSADWSLFSNPNVSEAQAQILLVEVFDDGEIVRGQFGLSESCRTDSLERWRALTDELKYVNRYFPDSVIDTERLGVHLSNLILRDCEKPEVWYRARIEKDGQPIPIDKMGAPPAMLATSGRANPTGIPYLYLGSTVETAICEVRAQPGEIVSVAEFVIEAGLKIVDLRAPRTLVSPFLEEDEGSIALLRGDIDFLEILGKELATPVVPDSAAINYIPSQFLCEFIKKCGFDGVAYSSSLSEGMNVALFLPEAATPQSVAEYEVASLSLIYRTFVR